MLKLSNFSSFLEFFAGFNLAFGVFNIIWTTLEMSIKDTTRFLFTLKRTSNTKGFLADMIASTSWAVLVPIISQVRIKELYLQFATYTIFVVFIMSYNEGVGNESIFTLEFLTCFTLSSIVIIFLNQYRDFDNENLLDGYTIDSKIDYLPFKEVFKNEVLSKENPDKEVEHKSNFANSMYVKRPFIVLTAFLTSFLCRYNEVLFPLFIVSVMVYLIIKYKGEVNMNYSQRLLLNSFIIQLMLPLIVGQFHEEFLKKNNNTIILLTILSPVLPTAYLLLITKLLNIKVHKIL